MQDNFEAIEEMHLDAVERAIHLALSGHGYYAHKRGSYAENVQRAVREYLNYSPKSARRNRLLFALAERATGSGYALQTWHSYDGTVKARLMYHPTQNVWMLRVLVNNRVALARRHDRGNDALSELLDYLIENILLTQFLPTDVILSA